MLEEFLHISELFDLYGVLLTQKQQRCLEMHLFEDFSLSEIGESMGISRQAVYDMIHRSEQMMEGYEAKLGFLVYSRRVQAELRKVYEMAASLQNEDAAVLAILERLSLLMGKSREE